MENLEPWIEVSLTVVLPDLLFGYIFGSIPFGLIITNFAGLGDIRKIGSGNIGTTNVLRTGNKKLAFLTLILDAMKGVIPILIYSVFVLEYNHGMSALIGLGAIIGHCFPIWLKFKGGKGVATALGVLLVSFPLSGITACLIWLTAAFTFRYSSLAAIFAMLCSPIVTYIFYWEPIQRTYFDFLLDIVLFSYHNFALSIWISLLVIYRHKENIRRLIKGEESKISFKKKVQDV